MMVLVIVVVGLAMREVLMMAVALLSEAVSGFSRQQNSMFRAG